MWAHVAHLPSMIKSNSLSLRETVSKKGFILDAIPNSHFKLDLSAFSEHSKKYAIYILNRWKAEAANLSLFTKSSQCSYFTKDNGTIRVFERYRMDMQSYKH